MLHHMLRAASKSPSVTYNAFTSSLVSGSTFTFNNVSIGTADDSRLVVAQVHAIGVSGNPVSTSSVTIAGVSAAGYQNNSDPNHTSLWAASVTSGTTATIVVNFPGAGADHCAIGVYSLYNLNSNVPISTQTATVTTNTVASLTVAVEEKGIVIAGISGGSNVTTTWSGVTERYDTTVFGDVRSGGDSTITAKNAAYSVQSTTSGNSNTVLVAGSWR